MKRNLTYVSICAVLILVLLLAVFTSCDSKPAGSSETTGGESAPIAESSTASGGEDSAAESETEALKGDFTIAENGSCNFVLVASERATSAEESALLSIRSSIADLTGATPDFVNDWIPNGASHDAETYEILIGKTNYNESWEILNNTSYGSYRIAVIGNKIILTAWADQAIKAGAEALIDIFETYVKDGAIVIPRSAISGMLIVDESLENFPVVPNLSMDHVYDANGASEAIYKRASKEDFYAYLEKLDASGYVKYAENEHGNVLSAIYTYGTSFTYNIFYEGGYNELCVLVEDYSAKKLPPKKSEYKKVCETQFAQVGLEYQYTSSVKLSSVQNGMCYIWRLEDGRFIILDGGFNYATGAANLYNTLRKMAVNPSKIVVATWAVSHFHGDHVGTFASFVQNYLWDVEIQSMLINLPTLEQSKLDDMNWGYWNTISNKLGNFNKDLVVYKAHPGQVYHFANAEIEIIYTLEMFAPKDLTYYNTCSVIMDVRFGDFNMMMLGDCSEDANQIMLANYGNTLEAEVVQVAHHGYIGGSNALYKAINPIYVFWPAGSTWYSTCEVNGTEDPTTDRSGYFFMKNTRVSKIFAAKTYIYICDVKASVGFTDCKRYQNITALMQDDFTAVSLK